MQLNEYILLVLLILGSIIVVLPLVLAYNASRTPARKHACPICLGLYTALDDHVMSHEGLINNEEFASSLKTAGTEMWKLQKQFYGEKPSKKKKLPEYRDGGLINNPYITELNHPNGKESK